MNRSAIKQGDIGFDTKRAQSVFPMVSRSARLQIAAQICRRQIFQPLRKEMRVARARREQRVPTLEQIRHVLTMMPAGSEIERRYRALIAFTLLTGARDGAIASLKLKHIDIAEGKVNQDAREVNTRFSKTFATYFFPVGDDVCAIVAQWVNYLLTENLWGPDDPLFPATQVTLGEAHLFEACGLTRTHWSNAGPIRTIFREALADLAGRIFAWPTARTVRNAERFRPGAFASRRRTGGHLGLGAAASISLGLGPDAGIARRICVVIALCRGGSLHGRDVEVVWLGLAPARFGVFSHFMVHFILVLASSRPTCQAFSPEAAAIVLASGTAMAAAPIAGRLARTLPSFERKPLM